MADLGIYTVRAFVDDHPKFTERDIRMCIKGTHPELPPLRAKKKRPGDNEPYLITREAAREWRAHLPDA